MTQTTPVMVDWVGCPHGMTLGRGCPWCLGINDIELARTAPESERSETRPTPGTTPQFRSRPVVPRHPDAEPGWSLPEDDPTVTDQPVEEHAP